MVGRDLISPGTLPLPCNITYSKSNQPINTAAVWGIHPSISECRS